MGRNEHVLATQYVPVDDVQSDVSHLQSTPAVFEVKPSVTAHIVTGRVEHVLEVTTQYMPVDDVQSDVPHWQSTPRVLEIVPFEMAQ